MKTLVISICREKLHDFEFVNPIVNLVNASNSEALIVHYKNLTEKELKLCEKAIICGTSLADFDYLNNIELFEWIHDFKKPLLGICAGMQIILACFYNSTNSKKNHIVESLEIGMTSVSFKQPFFGLSKKAQVYSLHHLGVSSVGKFFEKVATSNLGVQAIKHKTLPHYGCLFHPEVRQTEIIKEFIIHG